MLSEVRTDLAAGDGRRQGTESEAGPRWRRCSAAPAVREARQPVADLAGERGEQREANGNVGHLRRGQSRVEPVDHEPECGGGRGRVGTHRVHQVAQQPGHPFAETNVGAVVSGVLLVTDFAVKLVFRSQQKIPNGWI